MSAIDEIKETLSRLEMEDYLDREGISYRKTHGHNGTQLNIKECPVCGGNKWKVFLNAETGMGNCFSGSCEAKFNKWSFIKAHLGGPANKVVADHIKEIAREFGWRPRKRAEVAVEDTTGFRLPKSIALPTEDGQNLVYLEKRGVDAGLARYFHLRFCEEGFFAFKTAEGKIGTQNFSNRVIIPVYDLDGALVTFQGRDLTGTAEKKYLFPAGLPGTGRYLYNGHNALRARRLCMGEGAFDVFAIKRALDAAPETRDVVAVGSFGKHLSAATGGENVNDQLARFIKLMQLGLREVTIMWDGEPAALKAAIKAGERLLGLGLVVRLALLPKGCDPNEVDGIEVRKAFLQAVPLTRAVALKLLLNNPYG